MTLYQYNGSGILIKSSGIDEKRSYNYDLNASFDNTDDYQSISNNFTLSDDYGEVTQSSGQVEDYNIISESVSGTATPFGKFTLSGSAITQPNYRLYFSGSALEKVIYSPDNTSGTLFGFGEKVEKRTFDYNESSEENLEEDYGFVSNPATQIDDYLNITSSSTITVENGLITESVSGIIKPFGKFTLSGSAITQPNYRLYFSGSALEKVIYSPDNTSGTLFGFGSKLESVTYDYNSESIYQSTDDYGFVSASYSESDDYGLITETGGTQPEENYGFILDPITTVTVDPFGSLVISGSSVNSYAPNTPENTQLFILSGSLIEKETDSYSGSGTLSISGNALYTEIGSYIASGILFGFGSKIESVTYAYNQSSVGTSPEDFGLVSEIASEFINYGLINSAVDEGVDNYGIIGPTTSTPFGSIVISGTTTEEVFNKGGYSGSGSILALSGYSDLKFVSQTDESTQLLQISGIATYSNINSFVASGTLFGFGEKVESVTYDYNESSIVTFDGLDYGLISNLHDQDDDYGLIIDLYSGRDDYGFLVGLGATETLRPFGSITLSGTSVERDTESYVGLGTIFLSGVTSVLRFASYTGSGSIILSGTALESETEVYVGLGTLTISDTVSESEVDVYNGSGSITLSGTGVESFSAQTPEDTQLFILSGSLIEKETDLYQGSGSITLSGTALESETESYVGLGTIFISQSALESEVEFYTGSGSITLSGTGVESFSAQTPEDTQLFTLSGSLIEKETDSYAGSGSITLSGIALESETESYVGLGTITLSGDALCGKVGFYRGTGNITFSDSGLESRTIFIPTSGIGTGFIGGTISIFNESTRYYSPIYPGNSGDPGAGIGTIRINDDNQLTIYRATLPYFGRGTLVVSGIGRESFSKANYSGSGTLRLSGISTNREIAVYQDFVTSGSIVISQGNTPIIEKTRKSYAAVGIVTISGSRISETITYDYNGTGSLTKLSGASESYTAQTPDDTILLNISGSANEAFVTQGVENTVLYQFSGAATDEKLTKNYSGTGAITLQPVSATTLFAPTIPATGLFRFVRVASDETYDTCDSVDITSDYTDSARTRFVANPVENEVLLNISGSSSTQKVTSLVYVGSGKIDLGKSKICSSTETFNSTTLTFDSSLPLYTLDDDCDTIFSEARVSFTSDYSNTQLFNISGSSVERTSKAFLGLGTFAFSSSSESSITRQIPENIITINISGTSETRFESEYSYVGINLGSFSGSAETSVRKQYRQSGSGTITISGELLYPNIIFIPSPDGSGNIHILGSGVESITQVSTGSGTIFYLSGGFESISESTYIGIGTIYVDQTGGTGGTTANNPFQPPHTFVTII